MRVLFVCTGNTCRSPLAEYLARSLVLTDAEFEFASAGTSARDGEDIHPTAAAILAKRGIETSGFHSRRLTRTILDECDLVLCMERENRSEILIRFPRAVRKVFLLTELAAVIEASAGSIDDALPAPERIAAYSTKIPALKPVLAETPDVPDPINQDDTAFADVVARLLPALVTLTSAFLPRSRVRK